MLVVEWADNLGDARRGVSGKGLEERIVVCVFNARVADVVGAKEVGAHDAELEGHDCWVVPCLGAFRGRLAFVAFLGVTFGFSIASVGALAFAG